MTKRRSLPRSILFGYSLVFGPDVGGGLIGTLSRSQLPHGGQTAAADLMPLERIDRRRAAESRKTGGEI